MAASLFTITTQPTKFRVPRESESSSDAACAALDPPADERPSRAAAAADDDDDGLEFRDAVERLRSAARGGRAPTTKALRELLAAVMWQRTVAKEAGSGARAAVFAREAVQLEAVLHRDDEEEAVAATAAAPPPRESADAPLLQSAAACRNAARVALRGLKSSEGGVRQRECIMRAASELEAAVDVARSGGGGAAALRASVEFVAALRAALEKRDDDAAVACGFAACDALRGELRYAGVTTADIAR